MHYLIIRSPPKWCYKFPSKEFALKSYTYWLEIILELLIWPTSINILLMNISLFVSSMYSFVTVCLALFLEGAL